LFPGCCINTYNSPHHCVGFLFFAWIPPLLFPLPPRRFIPQLITPQLITAPLLTLLIADHTSHHILIITSHSSHHISHLTFHISHHISLITSLITSLLTSHSSHHNSSQLHFSHLAYLAHHISFIAPHLRRTTQSLLAELHTEHPGGAAARVAAAGPRLPFVWQAQYTEPPGGAAHRASWRSHCSFQVNSAPKSGLTG